MCREVFVVHYESIENDFGETIKVASEVFTETVINEKYILTATNMRTPAKDGAFFDTCKITFINGESINILGKVQIYPDGTIFFNDSNENYED